MFERSRLSRRQFLEMMGLAASAVTLGGCSSNEPVAVTATPSPAPPTPVPPLVTATESEGFEMVLVEAGTFEMGSAGGQANEQPVHTVSITRPYFVSLHLVTYDLYDQFTNDVGEQLLECCAGERADRPADPRWYDAITFCNWLSERSGLTPCYTLQRVASECDFEADGYRLPTEAEWEYAARGGSRSQGFLYAGGDDLDQVAWYAENSEGICHPVGQKLPNELGIYDMSGNLWEWCWDWYVRDYYSWSPADDPTGPDAAQAAGTTGRQKMRRGGFYNSDPSEARLTARAYDEPFRYTGPGIRLVRTAV